MPKQCDARPSQRTFEHFAGMRKKSLREVGRGQALAAQAPESISRDNAIGGWVAARQAGGFSSRYGSYRPTAQAGPDAVPEFVGEIYDLVLRRPEHGSAAIEAAAATRITSR
jgi:hypothetical protein